MPTELQVVRRVLLASAFALGAAWIVPAEEPVAIRADLEVPGHGKLDPDNLYERRIIDEYCRNLIEAREAYAEKQVALQKEKLIAEAKSEDARRKEEDRRRALYEKHFGTPPAQTNPDKKPEEPKEEKKASVRVRVTFTVPEALLYQAAAKTCRDRKVFCEAVLDYLARLDPSNTGKIAEDDYKIAGALLMDAAKFLRSLDNGGSLTIGLLGELDEVPLDPAAIVKANLRIVNSKHFTINSFDDNHDGVLDSAERKRMSLAFSTMARQYGQEAAFYQSISDGLTVRAKVVAARMDNIELMP
jgi:hypothetical protein